MTDLDEVNILDEMRLAVESDKLAGDPTGWVTSENGHDGLLQVLPVEVHAATVGTARLIWRAVRRSPDRDASVTLVVTIQGKDLTAWRMDWRPLLPHTNTCGPVNLKGLTVKTGIHEFGCNSRLGLRTMQSRNLPICAPVDPEPHDFDAFVRYVCKTLNVSLTEQVLEPIPEEVESYESIVIHGGRQFGGRPCGSRTIVVPRIGVAFAIRVI